MNSNFVLYIIVPIICENKSFKILKNIIGSRYDKLLFNFEERGNQMSYVYEKIQQLIAQNKDQKQLQYLYRAKAIEKLRNVTNPNRNCFVLLEDLKIHEKKYPKNTELTTNTFNNSCDASELFKDHKNKNEKITFKSDSIEDLQNRLFFYKGLHLRAIILDTADVDYVSDIQTFYKPEKWICDAIDHIDKIFYKLECKNDFSKYFLDVIVDTFVCKGKKFGYNGNQLLINLISYGNHFGIDIKDWEKKVDNNFVEGRLLNQKELKAIIEEYEHKKNKNLL